MIRVDNKEQHFLEDEVHSLCHVMEESASTEASFMAYKELVSMCAIVICFAFVS